MILETDKVAGLCYHEGWRDKNLIMMVAIIGSESGYDIEFDDGKRHGLFALKGPETASFFDPNAAAKIARATYEEKYFAPWITWATGEYRKFARQAVDGVGEFFYREIAA